MQLLLEFELDFYINFFFCHLLSHNLSPVTMNEEDAARFFDLVDQNQALYIEQLAEAVRYECVCVCVCA